MKIFVITANKTGCFYYRIRVPFEELGRKFGWEWKFDNKITDEDVEWADVVVGQLLHTSQALEGWKKLVGRVPLVYEVDDDLFTLDEVNGQSIWAEPEPGERVKEFIQLSDMVTTTTEHLANVYKAYNDNVAILPNSVPDWFAEGVILTEPEKFTIGYPCSSSHLADCQYYFEPLIKFMWKNPDAMFHWVGPKDPVAFPKWQQRCAHWINDQHEYYRYMIGKFTVGIAPLAPLKFNLSKSGIKADEYAALGIPCVVSDFQQYRDVVKDGETGIIVRSKGGWTAALQNLKNDPAYREYLGGNAKDAIQNRKMSRRVNLFEQAYRSLV